MGEQSLQAITVTDPEGIAVIGVANIHYSDSFRLTLSTIDQHSAVTGQRAGELLWRVLRSQPRVPPQKVLVPPKLLVREPTLPTRIVRRDAN